MQGLKLEIAPKGLIDFYSAIILSPAIYIQITYALSPLMSLAVVGSLNAAEAAKSKI